MALKLLLHSFANVGEGELVLEVGSLHKDLRDRIPFRRECGEKHHRLHLRSDGEVVGGEATKDGCHFLDLWDRIATMQPD